MSKPTASRIVIIIVLNVCLLTSVGYIKAQDTTWKSRGRAVAQAKDTNDILGTFRLDTMDIVLRNDAGITGLTIRIDSVSMIIRDGVIENITVIAGKWRFTNKRAPIAVTPRRFAKEDRLWGSDTAGREGYVILQKVIDFFPQKNYAPDYQNIVLTRRHPIIGYTKGTNISGLVDLRIFTDVLGLLGNASNGLAQFDGKGKFFFHHSNVGNTPLFFGRYVKADINFSKFDNSKLFIDSTNYSRSKLLQNSWFNFGLGLNVFDGSFNFSTPNRLYVDFGGSVSMANFSRITKTSVSDTLRRNDSLIVSNTNTIDTSSQPIISLNTYFDVGINFRLAENYGVTVSNRFMWNYNPQAKGLGIDDNAPHFFMCPSVEAFFNTFGDPRSRVFMKFNYYIDTRSGNENKNNFLQFQVGYSADLSKIRL